MCAYQVQNTSGVLLLVCVLDEEEKTLSGLARPRSDRVSNLGLLAAEVLAQVLSWDRLLAEPEVLLGEAEGATMSVSMLFRLFFFSLATRDSLLEARRLVAQSTALDGCDHLFLLLGLDNLLCGRSSLALHLGCLLGHGCLDGGSGVVAGNNRRGRRLDGAGSADLGNLDGLGGVNGGRHVVYMCLDLHVAVE